MRRFCGLAVLLAAACVLLLPASALADTDAHTWDHNGISVKMTMVWDEIDTTYYPFSNMNNFKLEFPRFDGTWIITGVTWKVGGNGQTANSNVTGLSGRYFENTHTTPLTRTYSQSTVQYNHSYTWNPWSVWLCTKSPYAWKWLATVTVNAKRGGSVFRWKYYTNVMDGVFHYGTLL